VTYEDAISELGPEVAASLASGSPLSGSPSTVLRIEAGKLTVLRQGELRVDL